MEEEARIRLGIKSPTTTKSGLTQSITAKSRSPAKKTMFGASVGSKFGRVSSLSRALDSAYDGEEPIDKAIEEELLGKVSKGI